MARWLAVSGMVLGLALLHGLLLLLGSDLVPPITNGLMFVANLYVMFCGYLVLRDRGFSGVLGFVAGYLVLFALLVLGLERVSLFLLLVLLYASVFRVGLLLGLFAIFVMSYVVFQPYAFETFAPLAAGFSAFWWLKKQGASRFLLSCLAVGLFSLMAVLLPLLHLIIQDTAQTMWAAFTRADVQSALGVSLLSSTIATVLVALGGIPLAYAMARSRFRGQGVVEALIDLPILVPQSVVGIALLIMLGPGSPLGQALEEAGLGVAGRFAGIVTAQVFVAFPFLVKTALTAFEAVPLHFEDVSRTLGAKPAVTFWRVALPMASRGVATGCILAWARAVSEFGAIVLFAPNPLSGPVLVHTEFLKAGAAESRPIASLLLMVCLWIFVLLQIGRAWLPAPFRTRAGGA